MDIPLILSHLTDSHSFLSIRALDATTNSSSTNSNSTASNSTAASSTDTSDTGSTAPWFIWVILVIAFGVFIIFFGVVWYCLKVKKQKCLCFNPSLPKDQTVDESSSPVKYLTQDSPYKSKMTQSNPNQSTSTELLQHQDTQMRKVMKEPT